MKNLAIVAMGSAALMACGGTGGAANKVVGQLDDGRAVYRDQVWVNGSQSDIVELGNDADESVRVLQSKINGNCIEGQAKFNSYGEWRYFPARDAAVIVVLYTCE